MSVLIYFTLVLLIYERIVCSVSFANYNEANSEDNLIKTSDINYLNEMYYTYIVKKKNRSTPFTKTIVKEIIKKFKTKLLQKIGSKRIKSDISIIFNKDLNRIKKLNNTTELAKILVNGHVVTLLAKRIKNNIFQMKFTHCGKVDVHEIEIINKRDIENTVRLSTNFINRKTADVKSNSRRFFFINSFDKAFYKTPKYTAAQNDKLKAYSVRINEIKPLKGKAKAYVIRTNSVESKTAKEKRGNGNEPLSRHSATAARAFKITVGQKTENTFIIGEKGYENKNVTVLPNMKNNKTDGMGDNGIRGYGSNGTVSGNSGIGNTEIKDSGKGTLGIGGSVKKDTVDAGYKGNSEKRDLVNNGPAMGFLGLGHPFFGGTKPKKSRDYNQRVYSKQDIEYLEMDDVVIGYPRMISSGRLVMDVPGIGVPGIDGPRFGYPGNVDERLGNSSVRDEATLFAEITFPITMKSTAEASIITSTGIYNSAKGLRKTERIIPVMRGTKEDGIISGAGIEKHKYLIIPAVLNTNRSHQNTGITELIPKQKNNYVTAVQNNSFLGSLQELNPKNSNIYKETSYINSQLHTKESKPNAIKHYVVSSNGTQPIKYKTKISKKLKSKTKSLTAKIKAVNHSLREDKYNITYHNFFRNREKNIKEFRLQSNKPKDVNNTIGKKTKQWKSEPFITFARLVCEAMTKMDDVNFQTLTQAFVDKHAKLRNEPILFSMGQPFFNALEDLKILMHEPSINETRKFFALAAKGLNERQDAFSNDLNSLLKSIDSVYDAKEQREIKAIAQAFIDFPNTQNKFQNASVLLNEVFEMVILDPFKRLEDTRKGNMLLKTLNSYLRKYFYPSVELNIYPHRRFNNNNKIYKIWEMNTIVPIHARRGKKNKNKITERTKIKHSHKDYYRHKMISRLYQEKSTTQPPYDEYENKIKRHTLSKPTNERQNTILKKKTDLYYRKKFTEPTEDVSFYKLLRRINEIQATLSSAPIAVSSKSYKEKQYFNEIYYHIWNTTDAVKLNFPEFLFKNNTNDLGISANKSRRLRRINHRHKKEKHYLKNYEHKYTLLETGYTKQTYPTPRDFKHTYSPTNKYNEYKKIEGETLSHYSTTTYNINYEGNKDKNSKEHEFNKTYLKSNEKIQYVLAKISDENSFHENVKVDNYMDNEWMSEISKYDDYETPPHESNYYHDYNEITKTYEKLFSSWNIKDNHYSNGNEEGISVDLNDFNGKNVPITDDPIYV